MCVLLSSTFPVLYLVVIMHEQNVTKSCDKNSESTKPDFTALAINVTVCILYLQGKQCIDFRM